MQSDEELKVLIPENEILLKELSKSDLNTNQMFNVLDAVEK